MPLADDTLRRALRPAPIVTPAAAGLAPQR
jgi:hypothetical protein